MWRIVQGDCREVLRTLSGGSVHTCITSPPYFRQRDYGVCGQVGLEESPEEYIDSLVQVFREVRRVLRSDGTLWLNLGDKYGPGKQLLGIPWRTALALQADGWILRSDVIWYKPDGMPNSQTDRLTTVHEYIFLFSKSEKYFFDSFAIRESATPSMQRVTDKAVRRAYAQNREPSGTFGKVGNVVETADTRGKRSVWCVSHGGSDENHFAAYPPALILPCVLAGTSEGGCCSLCGSSLRRVVERARVATRSGLESKVHVARRAIKYKHDAIVRVEGVRRVCNSTTLSGVAGNRDPERHVTTFQTVGWESDCSCDNRKNVPCLVLDPFLGTGTTLCVATSKGRDGVGIELNSDYVRIAERRVRIANRDKGFGL